MFLSVLMCPPRPHSCRPPHSPSIISVTDGSVGEVYCAERSPLSRHDDAFLSVPQKMKQRMSNAAPCARASCKNCPINNGTRALISDWIPSSDVENLEGVVKARGADSMVYRLDKKPRSLIKTFRRPRRQHLSTQLFFKASILSQQFQW
jgi:hypothetical protein